ncbi:CYFA0S18e01464g1_1 [Cyberlindnera fabianii]|uniref:CYFA0S18e01464g1_1 n=1 Tax=Cyberlindnera fabianii TaxID=36022 RepID=A0A061B7Q5_CYBFA|nr:CYFA0S18e01464g1_1 [Cyberlindnera fabianii]
MSSMADTYILASKARAKLTKEASRPDHDLRILVSHANMLDNLMDKIHAHRESILDGSYVAKNVSFTLPDITHVSIAEDDYDDVYDSDSDSDYDDDDDDEDDSLYHKATTVEYHADEDEYDDDDDEWDSLSDAEDDFSEEEDEFESNYTYSHASHSISPKKFRQMPTIDEMSEVELEELSSASEDEDEHHHHQHRHDDAVLEVLEHDETDITELKRTPSLVYSTNEEESEDEDDEDVLHTSQTHTPQTHNYDGSKPQSESPAVSHGDLLLENLHEESFVQTPTVLCT